MKAKRLLTIAFALIVVDLIASVVVAASSFTGHCESGMVMPILYDCTFVQHYFGFYNVSTNPFIDPLVFTWMIARIFGFGR